MSSSKLSRFSWLMVITTLFLIVTLIYFSTVVKRFEYTYAALSIHGTSQEHKNTKSTCPDNMKCTGDKTQHIKEIIRETVESKTKRTNETVEDKIITLSKADYVDKKLTKYLNVSLNVKGYTTSNSSRYITIKFVGRLGNNMFELASLIGIAIQNNMIPVYDKGRYLVPNSLAVYNKSVYRDTNSVFVQEKSAAEFDPVMIQLSEKYPLQDVRIGYRLECFKYFINYTDVIRRVLTFTEAIRQKTVAFYRDVEKQFGRNLINNIFVGIHVRRTDFLKPGAQQAGRICPNVTYFQNAMNYFKNQTKQEAIFIVCGDDPVWSEKYIKPLDKNVIISKGNLPAVDMAILSGCDHVIVSGGTFGMWAGFLSEGQIIHYANYPRKGSGLYAHTDKKNCYPPNTIGMTE